MRKGERVQVTLSDTAMEKLNKLCQDKGISRSAIIAMAIDKFFKGEELHEEKK